MHGTRIRLIRAELYEKVWTTPMRTLAEEFNLSDVGLAKICRKHDIPLPPVGYWRQKETGHELPRPPLHPANNGAETLDISVRERMKPEFATLAAEPTPKIPVDGHSSNRPQRLRERSRKSECRRGYRALHGLSRQAGEKTSGRRALAGSAESFARRRTLEQFSICRSAHVRVAANNSRREDDS
jgi:hypothetical protein